MCAKRIRLLFTGSRMMANTQSPRPQALGWLPSQWLKESAYVVCAVFVLLLSFFAGRTRNYELYPNQSATGRLRLACPR